MLLRYKGAPAIGRRGFGNAGWRLVSAATAAVLMLTLTGCLYPKDKPGQQAPPKEAVRNVQAAIDQYYDEQGLLPIINASQDVPKYEKFRLDFAKLQSKGYLSAIPNAAFENGGNYYFLIIDEETDPNVRLMDIVTFQRVNDIQQAVTAHVGSGGDTPKKEAVYPGFYEIDYNAISLKAPSIRSIYSGGALQAMIDDSGRVYVDYGIEIMQLLQKQAPAAVEEGADLRILLVNATEFVPVKSPEYRLNEAGEPQAVLP